MLKDGESVLPPKEQSVPVQAVKIKIGSREFDTQEAADAYFADLEKKASRPAESINPEPKPVQISDSQELIDGQSIDEVMISNPKRYHQYVLKKASEIAEERIKQENGKQALANETRRAEEAWWNDFYKQNPDLKKAEKLVKSELMADWTSFSRLDPEKAKSELAKRSRETLTSAIKEFGGKTKEETLSKGGAKPLDGSSTSGDGKPRTTGTKSMTFAEQIKAMQRRGQKAS